MVQSKTDQFNDKQNELAKIAKALAHPARIAILDYLLERNVCFSGDISTEIPLGRSTVSQHLKELKQAGLIQGKVSGKYVKYCICSANLSKIINCLNEFVQKLNDHKEIKC